MAGDVNRWRDIADLDARAGQPVGKALREAADEVERLHAVNTRLGAERTELLGIIKRISSAGITDAGQRDLLAQMRDSEKARADANWAAIERVRALDKPEVAGTRLYDPAREQADQDLGHADDCEWHEDGHSYCSCATWPAACAVAGVVMELVLAALDQPTTPKETP